MTRARGFLRLVAGLFALHLVACDDVPTTGPADGAASQFWDDQWSFLATSVEDENSARLPLHTDFDFLERLEDGEDGGPRVTDVLEGAVATFALDGRLLVKPAGAEAPEYLWTDYHVIDGLTLELSVHKSNWVSHRYSFDETSDTLLIESEEDGGPAVTPFVFDVIERTLFSGSLDSAAARVDALVFEDPRCAPAMDAFLFAVIHGQEPSIPIRDSAGATAWVIFVLRQTGVVSREVSDETLTDSVSPIVDEILTLASDGLSRALFDRLLEIDAVTEVIPADRVERVLRFALYRRVLETSELANVSGVDILFERAPSARSWPG